MGAVRALLASGNPHKLAELRRILPGWELELAGALDFPPETGATYEENARAKALFALEATGSDAWVIGEDSGIEVDALGGRPGIESARWSANWLEDMLREVGDAGGDRRARYRCELVAVAPGGVQVRGSGVLEGSIALEPRGSEGFGYDPIFVPEGETRTVAELGDAWKAAHSHRARAARALAEALEAPGLRPGRRPPPRRAGRGRGTS